MSPRIEVVILAHDHRDALEELIGNVQFFVPEAEVVVFNGGTDEGLTVGLGVDVCPYSSPLRLGNLVPFHWGVQRWMRDAGVPFDFLVVLDSDQLFVRHGFAEFLEATMVNSEFMAGGYLEVPARYYPDWDEVRRINYSWKRYWEPLYGLPHPAWGFNPGTVFRREYMDRVFRFANTEKILRVAGRSRIYGIEEFVFSTLAGRLGCNPIRHPGSHGLVSGYPSPETFARCLKDPDVFLIHKVHMEMDAPDRQMVRELRNGGDPDVSSLVRFAEKHRRAETGAAPSWSVSTRARLKDLYFQILP
jgi:hypothetical protein